MMATVDRTNFFNRLLWAILITVVSAANYPHPPGSPGLMAPAPPLAERGWLPRAGGITK